jgi:hypothetical protein
VAGRELRDPVDQLPASSFGIDPATSSVIWSVSSTYRPAGDREQPAARCALPRVEAGIRRHRLDEGVRCQAGHGLRLATAAHEERGHSVSRLIGRRWPHLRLATSKFST